MLATADNSPESLNKIAFQGQCYVYQKASHWGNGESYLSEKLNDPTWLDLCVTANTMLHYIEDPSQTLHIPCQNTNTSKMSYPDLQMRVTSSRVLTIPSSRYNIRETNLNSTALPIAIAWQSVFAV
jgi:hypothetical protein